MIGELPESYDDWKTRVFEFEDDYDICPYDDRNAFEQAIDKQIELEQEEKTQC